jgi:putative DNA primase/helicase
VTAPVVFRAVEKWKPTLLIDEADTFLHDSDELRGVLNSGHNRRSAIIIRTVGEDHEPKQFSTWCPKVISKIGKLPPTNQPIHPHPTAAEDTR